MIDYELDEKYIVRNSSTSRGCQIKYFKDGYWYKMNQLGYENLAEVYSCLILKYLFPEKYVKYELCRINGRPGCRSKNFLGTGEILQTFQHIYEIHYGRKINDELMRLRSTKSRYEYVIDFMKSATGLDVNNYLRRVLNLDMLILNEDRHFDNLAVIYNEQTGIYREAPIFDNGLSLLSDYGKYDPAEELEELIGKVSAATLSGSFEQQAEAAGIDLHVMDADGLRQELAALPENRCKKVLVYQMRRYDLL